MRFSAEAPAAEACFYDEAGRRTDYPSTPLHQEYAEAIEGYGAECDAIADDMAIEKPAWFTEAEADARDFIGTLGFEPRHPIHLLGEHKDISEAGFDDELMIAVANPFDNCIFVRAKRMEMVSDRGGETLVASYLVHELAHVAAERIGLIAFKQRGEEMKASFRTGFITTAGDELTRGTFFEEGFAHFLAGWYRRARDSDYQSVVDVADNPPLVVPSHLQPPDPAMTAGPDGYAMELLAWGAQRRSLMSGSGFVSIMLETRRSETQTDALRAFAQTIEAIRPGLYGELSQLQYGKAAWQIGLQAVHRAITAS